MIHDGVGKGLKNLIFCLFWEIDWISVKWTNLEKCIWWVPRLLGCISVCYTFLGRNRYLHIPWHEGHSKDQSQQCHSSSRYCTTFSVQQLFEFIIGTIACHQTTACRDIQYIGLGTAVGYRSRLCIGFCFHLANSDEIFPQDYDIHMLGDRFCCNRYNYCAEKIAFLSLIFSYYSIFCILAKWVLQKSAKVHISSF